MDGAEYIIMKVALAEAQTHIKEEIKRGDPLNYFAEQLSRNEEAFEVLEKYK